MEVDKLCATLPKTLHKGRYRLLVGKPEGETTRKTKMQVGV
jgi:hypothetical protein